MDTLAQAAVCRKISVQPYDIFLNFTFKFLLVLNIDRNLKVK